MQKIWKFEKNLGIWKTNQKLEKIWKFRKNLEFWKTFEDFEKIWKKIGNRFGN